eukprot:CAMPEP_0196666752 /NCGR_PEP_ID=MMETSP1086-20130531/64693_1 /TAXON_ID=77921 /ORGANISM="Cyanoptyche  gloeocystis , Strain SAG4.97" /LENGTH=298 /DNA_ID=CAMNT_0042003989 /DNA_START=91 /DNA_END=987 /DNA_ORIENTATION=-
MVITNPNTIKNKVKRLEVVERLRNEKKKEKKKERTKKKREAEAGEDQERPKKLPRTIETMREADETIVQPEDAEVDGDEMLDEFADYFAGTIPKILITTSKKPAAGMYKFIEKMLWVFPNSYFYARKGYDLKKIIQYATNKGFTDIIIWHEDNKKLNSVVVSHLPSGPTAYFKVTSLKMPHEIEGHGKPTAHKPELILNNFNTRLGRRLGRMMAALFPHDPNFRGRRVVTLHNQRDFIFFRHHRYVFDNDKKARLQELGPRFTLKLKALQKGTFDTTTGEFEWLFKSEMNTSRKRFFV